jgi:soluble lytic murein transglycosylase-like protein
MNIHVQLWQDLGINRKSMMDIPTNIEAGAYILGQLWNKTEQPTIAKVATLYVKLGATEVNDYGRTVEKFYKTRPWEQITRVDQEK